jgi:plastocyanin
MRRAIRLLGPALLVSVLAVGCASTPAASPAPATGAVSAGAISIKGFAFNPAQVSVTKGATVTWTNDDSTTHTVTSGVPGTPSGKFDQQLEPSKTFTLTFTDAGTYEFFCKIHTSMKAMVLVK